MIRAIIVAIVYIVIIYMFVRVARQLYDDFRNKQK